MLPENPAAFKDCIVGLMFIVQVPEPELPSKIATSLVDGTVAFLAPPLVADQLVVLFQFPVPPDTQYRFAIGYSCGARMMAIQLS